MYLVVFILAFAGLAALGTFVYFFAGLQNKLLVTRSFDWFGYTWCVTMNKQKEFTFKIEKKVPV